MNNYWINLKFKLTKNNLNIYNIYIYKYNQININCKENNIFLYSSQYNIL